MILYYFKSIKHFDKEFVQGEIVLTERKFVQAGI